MKKGNNMMDRQFNTLEVNAVIQGPVLLHDSLQSSATLGSCCDSMHSHARAV